MSQHASAPPNGGDAQHDMYAAWLASQQNPAAFGDGAFGHYPPPMPPPPQDGQFPMPPFPPPFPLPPFPPQAFGYGQPPAPTQEPVLDSNGKQRALYIGNLDPRVNEVLLLDLFATAGEVINVKIVPDRNGTHNGLNYGFVEFMSHEQAEVAIFNFNERKILDSEIKVNWASQGTMQKEDTSNHFHIFVGDLSPEITEETLAMAFKPFGSLSEARIMWDPKTSKSRGYGFVSFRERIDAEQAITTMSGEWLGSRQIRVNWANQKTQAMVQAEGRGEAPQVLPRQNTHSNVPGVLTYEEVVAQSMQNNVTVYVGNLPPGLSQEALIVPFAQYGYVMEVRIQQDRGFAFVKMDSHHTATLAIVALNGQKLFGPNGIRCSWGRDRME